MRKITKLAKDAFFNKETFKKDNTEVFYDEYDQKTRMLLHGNCIATLQDDWLSVSNCGWQTNTTKERLNGILSTLNFKVFQKMGEWFIDYGDNETGLFRTVNNFDISK